MLPPSTHLRPITRLFWLFLTLGLGVIPSGLFFLWVERNMALPGVIDQKLGWPWVAFWDAPLATKLAWNIALFLAFGVFHSLLAQPFTQAGLKKILPVQCVRAFYLCFTGASLLALMGSWQSTGLLVWVVPGLPFWGLSALSLGLFLAFFLGLTRVMLKFDPLEFFGLRQIYSRPEQIERMSAGDHLLEDGIYSVIRHPIYFFTLSAFIVTPMMSLDRAVLTTASVLYLYFGIPIEERKLDRRFGGAYSDYRRRVPAVVPRISSIGRLFKTR